MAINTNNTQWGNFQTDDVKNLNDIYRWLKKLETVLTTTGLPIGGGWTDAGTTVKLTTITDKVGIGVTPATYKLHVVSNDASVLNISGTVDTGITSGIEINNELDGTAGEIGTRLYTRGATYDSLVQTGTISGFASTRLIFSTATSESSITLGPDNAEIYQNDGGIPVLIRLSDAGVKIQGKDSGTTNNVLTLYQGNVTEFTGAAIASFRNDKQVTLNGLAGNGIGIAAVSNTGVLSFTGKTGVIRELWVDAGAMVHRTTNGPATETSETATNDIMLDSYLFDGATEEAVQFKLSLPQAWNAGTVKVKVYWTPATGASAADGVVWGVSAGALANDDAIDTALGTEVLVTDTVIAVGDLHITSATGAITIAGSPTVDEMLIFQIARKVGNASDDMTEDAKLLGVKLQYTETTTEPAVW